MQLAERHFKQCRQCKERPNKLLPMTFQQTFSCMALTVWPQSTDMVWPNYIVLCKLLAPLGALYLTMRHYGSASAEPIIIQPTAECHKQQSIRITDPVSNWQYQCNWKQLDVLVMNTTIILMYGRGRGRGACNLQSTHKLATAATHTTVETFDPALEWPVDR